jgi:hypothetical protein
VSFTVVPIYLLCLDAGTVFPFSKFTIQGVPKWLPKDSILENLSRRHRDSVHQATHGLVSEYNPNSWGHPDPEWTGTEPKGIHEFRWQSES